MRRPGVAKKLQIDSEHEPDLALISKLHPLPENTLTPDVLAILNCTLKNGPKARMPVHSELLPEVKSATQDASFSSSSSPALSSSVAHSSSLTSRKAATEGASITTHATAAGAPSVGTDDAYANSEINANAQESSEGNSVDSSLLSFLLTLRKSQSQNSQAASTSMNFESTNPSRFNADPLQQLRQLQQERDLMLRWRCNQQMQHYADLIRQSDTSSGARALLLLQQQQRNPVAWTVESAPVDVVQRSIQQMIQNEQNRALQQGSQALLLAQAEKELIARLVSSRNSPSGLLGQQVYSLPHRTSGPHMASSLPQDLLSAYKVQEASLSPSAISQQIVDEHISRNMSRRLMDTLKSMNAVRLSAYGSPFPSSSYEQRSTADLLQNLINECYVPTSRRNQYETTMMSETIRAALDSQALASMKNGENSDDVNGREC